MIFDEKISACIKNYANIKWKYLVLQNIQCLIILFVGNSKIFLLLSSKLISECPLLPYCEEIGNKCNILILASQKNKFGCLLHCSPFDW